MKKVLFLIATTALLCAAVSCSEEDEPIRTVFTVSTTMINHMVNTSTDEVLGIATTQNKLVLDTLNHKASLDLKYNDGSEKTLSINDIVATSNGLFFTLTSPSNSQFSGYVDFSEGGAMRYRYVTDNGIRIISTTPEVFFRNTQSIITYDDTTNANTSYVTMYQFDISPSTNTAIVKVSDILHVKDLKNFIDITANNNVPITVTPNGFSIAGVDLKTTAHYKNYVDSTNSTVSTTNKYPFKTFNATIDLVNDHLDANYMIGSSATVVAMGRTYPDYITH